MFRSSPKSRQIGQSIVRACCRGNDEMFDVLCVLMRLRLMAVVMTYDGNDSSFRSRRHFYFQSTYCVNKQIESLNRIKPFFINYFEKK